MRNGDLHPTHPLPGGGALEIVFPAPLVGQVTSGLIARLRPKQGLIVLASK